MAPEPRDRDLEAVRWHDLECGAYAADLPFWRTLAAARPDPDGSRVFDVGCGTGRVAIALARAGHPVLGLDSVPAFTTELRRRAALASVPAGAVVGDMVRPPATGERFGLVAIPMQTIQLLPNASARVASLRALAATLAPGAALAVAIVTDVEPFSEEDSLIIAPDMRDFDGTVFASRPTAVVVDPDRIVLHRAREIVRPNGHRDVERNATTLRPLTAAQLVVEASQAGLRASDHYELEPTDEHAGSTVVIFGA